MKLVYTPIIIFAFSLSSLTSCSSKQSDKKTAPLPGPQAPFDTKAFLAYNPKDGDKKIDAVMQNLHKTRAFNGNVLVAKHGKIIYEKSDWLGRLPAPRQPENKFPVRTGFSYQNHYLNGYIDAVGAREIKAG